MKENKKTFGIIIGIIILIALVSFAMYFYTNRDKLIGGTDNQDLQSNGDVSPTPQPTLAENGDGNDPLQVTSGNRSLAVYLDKNLNLEKDQNELNCGTYCINKEILLADAQNPNNPQGAVLNAQGKSGEEIVGANTLVWALLPDKNLLIPPTNFAFGDGVEDVLAPAWEISGIVAGINANATATDEENAIIYHFEQLIPLMKTAADNGKMIWVKVTPDKNKPAIYYLAQGTLSAVEDGFSLRVPVEALSSGGNALAIESVDFVIL